MTTTADAWVAWQRDEFRLRRRILRDVLFDKVMRTLFWNMTIEGLDNIPAAGPTILTINHITAADPLAVLGACRPRFVVPMSKIENFTAPGIGLIVRSWGAFPVRRGEADREALRITLELLKAGEITLIAPEGTRNPALRQPKDGLTYIAIKADPLIVPTAVWGAETWVDDLYKPWKRTRIHVRFGPAFRLRADGRKRVPRDEMARMTDEMMYQIAKLLPEDRRGQYSDLSRATTDYLAFVR